MGRCLRSSGRLMPSAISATFAGLMTMGLPSRVFSVSLLLVAVLITGAAARPAQAAAKRKVGVSLNGLPAGPIREAISDVLKKHGFEATGADLSGESEDAVASAAKQGRLAAVIVGEIREGGKRAKLRVYGASGDLIGEGSWSEKGG